jgi:hypothetical protein
MSRLAMLIAAGALLVTSAWAIYSGIGHESLAGLSLVLSTAGAGTLLALLAIGVTEE